MSDNPSSPLQSRTQRVSDFVTPPRGEDKPTEIKCPGTPHGKGSKRRFSPNMPGWQGGEEFCNAASDSGNMNEPNESYRPNCMTSLNDRFNF